MKTSNTVQNMKPMHLNPKDLLSKPVFTILHTLHSLASFLIHSFTLPCTRLLQDQDSVRKGEFSWLGFDWGRRGGLQARELALWVQLQREFRRRNLLGTDAIKRLEAIGFNWEPEVSHSCCS